ncbi:MAG: mismatch repair protein MutS2 [Patescibacteria group bacterium]|nr:mismatch repair protein MutS2 [Patescibacteria group bacterium]
MDDLEFVLWSVEMDPLAPVLDVHGFSVETALLELDFFVDRSVVHGAHGIKIIHGVGTGALRSAITRALMADRRIRGFRESQRPGEGGAVIYAALV